MQQVEAHCGEGLPKVLLGNKIDLLNEKEKKSTLEHFRP
jgi:hypothetical protein